MRFAIVAARFNERITQRLVAGALGALRAARLGPDAIEVHWVPGSFELPQAAGHLAATGRFAGIVCVGVVIRGQTPHFEHIAREAAAGIRQVAIEYGVPATFGVITSLTEEQAWARAGGEVGNRGEEAAEAALQMAEWVRSIQTGGAAGRSPARRSLSSAAERASRGHVHLAQATRGPRRPQGPRYKGTR
jgi:6,7-dimethyl-8-ribityllumazine synthase